MTYRDIDPKLAGIYIFKNNINGKCYVGQGVSLRKRLKQHLNNVRTHKYDLPIYKAIYKYGFHNFTVDILESFIPENISNEELIKKLDKLEIKYIEEYDSYNNGYNCTKGGDYGVLGLKMTEEQKKNISKAVRENIAKGLIGKRVYMYNFKEKYYIYAWTIRDASNITNLGTSTISRLCNNKCKFSSNFLASFSLEDLNLKKENLPAILLQNDNRCKGRFTKGHGNKNWFKGMVSLNKGKKMSEEQKEKLRHSLSKNYILQYNLAGKLLNTFETVRDAATYVKGNRDTIRCACNGKQKTAYGYVWKYKAKQ